MRLDSYKADAGVTLVEVLLGAVVAAVLIGLAFRTTSGMKSAETASGHKAQLQTHGQRALRAIVRDLQRAVNRTTPGAELPYVFDDGVAVEPYASHSHTKAQSEATLGESDYGPNREIVFVLPQDADNDGRPDLVANAIVWSADEVSYTVITDTAGNALVRSVKDGSQSIVARYIERIVFDTAASSGFTIPLGTVRVRLFLRARDKEGTLYREKTETLVRLQQENP